MSASSSFGTPCSHSVSLSVRGALLLPLLAAPASASLTRALAWPTSEPKSLTPQRRSVRTGEESARAPIAALAGTSALNPASVAFGVSGWTRSWILCVARTSLAASGCFRCLRGRRRMALLERLEAAVSIADASLATTPAAAAAPSLGATAAAAGAAATRRLSRVSTSSTKSTPHSEGWVVTVPVAAGAAAAAGGCASAGAAEGCGGGGGGGGCCFCCLPSSEFSSGCTASSAQRAASTVPPVQRSAARAWRALGTRAPFVAAPTAPPVFGPLLTTIDQRCAAGSLIATSTPSQRTRIACCGSGAGASAGMAAARGEALLAGIASAATALEARFSRRHAMSAATVRQRIIHGTSSADGVSSGRSSDSTSGETTDSTHE